MADSEDTCDDLHDDHSGESCAPASDADMEAAAVLLRALGDPARLRILERLGNREHCVSELAAESGDQPSTVSQRLRLLRAHRLVARRRDGKHIYYRLADDHVVDLIRSAVEHVQET